MECLKAIGDIHQWVIPQEARPDPVHIFKILSKSNKNQNYFLFIYTKFILHIDIYYICRLYSCVSRMELYLIIT